MEDSRMATNDEFKLLYYAVKNKRDEATHLLQKAFPFVRQVGSQELVNEISRFINKEVENGPGIIDQD